MILQVVILSLYLASVWLVSNDAPPVERIQVCALIVLTLLSERILRHMDPVHHHEQHHDDGGDTIPSLDEWFSPSISCYALMAICFLSVVCINSGGTIGKCILWRVNEEYIYILYPEDLMDDDDEDRGYDYHDDTHNKQVVERRKQRLLDYFERHGCLQVIHDNTTTESSRHHVQSTNDTRISSSSTCLICLESFQARDILVWSQNRDCSHAFHRDCLLDFFSRVVGRGEAAPCPCCRRDFCMKTTANAGTFACVR